MIAVSPVVNLLSLVVIATVGAVVSGTIVLILMLTEALSVFGLPAMSVNVSASIETLPSAVLFDVGVKVAE